MKRMPSRGWSMGRVCRPVVAWIGVGLILVLLYASIGGGLAALYGPGIVPCPPGGIPVSASVTVGATSDTYHVTITDPGNVWIYWGNTTSYVYTDINGAYESTSFNHYVDFLQASTTYHYEVYEIVQGPGYHCAGAAQGTFKTSTDSTTYFSGIVYDSAGATAPSNIYILAACAAPPPSGYSYSDVYTATASGGTFSFGASPTYVEDGLIHQACGSGGYAVVVENFPVYYIDNNLHAVWSGQWGGFWNETLKVFSPETVDPVLSSDFTAPSTSPTVQVAEFTDTGLVSLSVCSSSSSTEQFESSSTTTGSLFGVSYSFESTSLYLEQLGTGSCTWNQGEPGFEIWGESTISGMIQFNGTTTRQPWVAWEQYFGGLFKNGNEGYGNATGAPLQSWISEPTQNSQACYIGGVHWLNWPVIADTGATQLQVYLAGTTSTISSLHWGATGTLELDIGGSISVQGTASYSFSQGSSLSASNSNSFFVGINIPDLSHTEDYTIACTGGSQGGTGVVVDVWAS